jgi:hypothetical protein
VKLIQPSPDAKSLVSPPRARGTPGESPLRRRTEIADEVDLLGTLSPIHPNIMPALVPRKMADAQRTLNFV